MSNYTIVTNFLSKDSLISGNALKALKGAELTTEFTTVQTAVNSKVDGSTQYFPDGNAAQPSVGFTNNAGTGMYNTGGVLGFATGATNRISIASTGAVSVAAPGSGVALSVSSVAGTQGIDINQASGSAYQTWSLSSVNKGLIGVSGSAGQLITGSASGDLCFRIASAAMKFSVDNGSTASISLSSSGNVTVSAPSSGAALSVTAGGTATALQLNAAASQTAYITFSANNGSQVSYIGVSGGASGLITGDVAGDIDLRSAVGLNVSLNGGVAKSFSITSAGNVTVAPPTSGVSLTLSAGGSYATPQFNILSGQYAMGVDAGGNVFFKNTNNGHYFFTNSAGSATLDINQGNVSISAPASGVALAVTGVGGTTATLTVDGGPVYAGIPQNLQLGASYTFVLTDANKHVFQNAGGAHTYTIPANASVAFPIGTAITLINGVGAGNLTLNITTDTLNWLPTGATGSRTIAGSGQCTLLKVGATVWYVTGVGIT